MGETVDKVMGRDSRMGFLLDLMVLDHLCDTKSLRRLEATLEHSESRDGVNLLRGYLLAVATSLFNVLEFAVFNGNELDLEEDDGPAHWLLYGFYKRRGSIVSAVSDLKSDLARLCRNFDDLFGSLRRSGGESKGAFATIRNCGEFGAILRTSLGECKVVERRDGSEIPNGGAMLPWLLAERVWDYSDRLTFPDAAYQFVWGGDEEPPQPSEGAALEAESHLDDMVRRPLLGRMPGEWRNGLYFGLDAVLRLEGIVLPSHSASHFYVDNSAKWADELESFVKAQHPTVEWPQFEYGLDEFTGFSKADLMRHLPESDSVTSAAVSAKQKLSALLGPDTVRQFTPGSSTDFIDLEVFVGGAVQAQADTPVEILVVTHSVESDNREWVSIAVRSRRETLIANNSRWYLFFKMYHEGPVEDSAVGHARAAVRRLLARYEENLKITWIPGATDHDLLAFCEPPGFEAIQKLYSTAVDVNSELRAGLYELMAAYWLQSQGYSNVHVSLKDASLGKLEYDVLGVKSGQCLVVEVKGGNVTDRALQMEVDGLSRKVEHLQSRLSSLAKALGCEGSISRVSGLFVSLANVQDVEVGAGPVDIWGFEDFIKRLRDAGLSSRILKLLAQGHIIRFIDLTGLAGLPVDERP